MRARVRAHFSCAPVEACRLHLLWDVSCIQLRTVVYINNGEIIVSFIIAGLAGCCRTWPDNVVRCFCPKYTITL